MLIGRARQGALDDPDRAEQLSALYARLAVVLRELHEARAEWTAEYEEALRRGRAIRRRR